MGRRTKNKIIDSVFVNRIGHGGIGIGELENKKKVLIKGNIVPGCTVKCFVTKQKKDYIEAKVVEVVDSGKQDFVKSKCLHYNNIFTSPLTPLLEGEGNKSVVFDETVVGCGGCKWQMLSYENQLSLKMKLVSDSFRHQTEVLKNTNFRDIIGTGKEYFYRNKIEFSFGKYLKQAEKGIKNEEGEKGKNEIVGSSDCRDCEKTSKKEFSIKKDFQVGFHKQGMFSKVIDVEQCFLVSEKVDNLYKQIKELCKESGLPVHDQKSHEGFFRHLVIREGFNTNQVLINLVVSSDYLDNQQKTELWTKLKQDFSNNNFLVSQIKTFCITENNGLADVVKGQNVNIYNLRGDGFIFEELRFVKEEQEGGKRKNKGNSIEAIVEEGQIKITKKESDLPDIQTGYVEGKNTKSRQKKHGTLGKSLFSDVRVSFRVSPFSFFQTNTYGAEILFKTAFDLIGQVRGTIFDLYCGAGTIGLSLLKQGMGNFVVGIEIVKEAIVDANYNSKINGLEDKTYFVDGKAENLVYSDLVLQEKVKDLGLVIVDPPRDGLHKNVIKFLNNLKKSHQTKLLYISCNPVTMARDLGFLYEGGRKVDILQAVDMFPQTHHVEMIGVLR